MTKKKIEKTRNFKLTWNGKIWKKVIDGTQYTFGTGSETEAVEQLKVRYRQLDDEKANGTITDKSLFILKDGIDNFWYQTELESQLKKLMKLNKYNTKILTPFLAKLQRGMPVLTLSADIDSYIKQKESKYENKGIGPHSFRNFKSKMKHIRTFIDLNGVEDMNETTVSLFYQFLTAKKDITLTHKNGLWNLFRGFVRFLVSQKKIELPANLNSPDMMFPIETPEPNPYTIEEALDRLKFADEQQYLHILLSLNCGFTQKDISTLKLKEIENGYIIRKRGKTKNYARVPTVKFKLWDKTQELLNKQMSKSGVIALLNENGKPFLVETTSNRNCEISNSMQRLARLSKMSVSFKRFRKTAASNIDSQFAKLLLGHVPGDIAEKHYVKYDQSNFDSALSELGKKLGF